MNKLSDYLTNGIARVKKDAYNKSSLIEAIIYWRDEVEKLEKLNNKHTSDLGRRLAEIKRYRDEIKILKEVISSNEKIISEQDKMLRKIRGNGEY